MKGVLSLGQFGNTVFYKQTKKQINLHLHASKSFDVITLQVFPHPPNMFKPQRGLFLTVMFLRIKDVILLCRYF